MSKQWQRMHKNDTYYKQAKSTGYRSRAVYKLLQINKKFRIFRTGDNVLDLGSAPGGWAQAALSLVGTSGVVVGIDLEPIRSLEGVKFFIGDITDNDVIEVIKNKSDLDKFEIIISDAAPNISGNYSLDQANSIYLAEASMKIVLELLKPNGNFVVKIFEGEDFNEFFNYVKTIFRFCRKYSPQASRARSSEIYVVCKGFKGMK